MLEKHDYDLITRFDSPNHIEREKLLSDQKERTEVFESFFWGLDFHWNFISIFFE